MKAPERLHERLRAEARRRGFRIQNSPSELQKTRMQGASAIDTEGASNEVVLPTLGFYAFVTGSPSLRMGQFAVLIGDLSEAAATEEAVGSLWRRYQARAAIARSWLPEAAVDDLCLVLAGPEGSANDSFWIAQAAEVERNDLVCRKLVWLPPAHSPDAAEDESFLSLFVARTFLARPWEIGSDLGQPAIDSLATIRSQLADLNAPEVALQAWLDLLEAPTKEDEDVSELVSKLIGTYPVSTPP